MLSKMARRKPYTKVEKKNEMRPDRVTGDVVYRRFECLSPSCTHLLVVLDDKCTGDFRIECPACSYLHFEAGTLHVFDYRLVNRKTGEAINEGPFEPTHAAYINAAERVKYCLYCYTMQPLDNFDHHKSRKSGRQGECRMCKHLYNGLKNESRLAEQHREAADTRRLLTVLSGEVKIGTMEGLLDRFEHKCFNCSEPLLDVSGGIKGYYIDHTLPVSWLWPLDHGPTLLCRGCNGKKSDKWPSEFYKEESKLRTLSTRTGIPFADLSGKPFFNPVAVKRLHDEADAIIERWVKYPEKLKTLRLRIDANTGEDVFRDASPQALNAIGLEPLTSP